MPAKANRGRSSSRAIHVRLGGVADPEQLAGGFLGISERSIGGVFHHQVISFGGVAQSRATLLTGVNC
jgi:hypothetical protein